jgi:hypothetical protein
MTNGALGINCWTDQRYASRGSKQAWMRLERLRSKVWQKLGLDHNVQWMRSLSASNPQPGSYGAPDQPNLNKQVIARYPVQLDQINGANMDLSMDAEAQKYVSHCSVFR